MSVPSVDFQRISPEIDKTWAPTAPYWAQSADNPADTRRNQAFCFSTRNTLPATIDSRAAKKLKSAPILAAS